MAVTVSTTLLAAANAAATAASDGQKNEAFCSAIASGIGANPRLVARRNDVVVCDVRLDGSLTASRIGLAVPESYTAVYALNAADIDTGTWTLRFEKNGDPTTYLSGSIGRSSGDFTLSDDLDPDKPLAISGVLMRSPSLDSVSRRWYPGHYYMVTDDVTRSSLILPSRRSLVQSHPYMNYMGWFWWHMHETSKGVYDFSRILQALDIAAADGKTMNIVPANRSFHGTARGLCAPQYLYSEGYVYSYSDNQENVLAPKFWTTYVRDRWNEYLTRMLRAIDGHPALGLVYTEECSIHGAYLQSGFTWQAMNEHLNEQVAVGAAECKNALFHQNMGWSNEPHDDVTTHYAMTDNIVRTHKLGCCPNDIYGQYPAPVTSYGKYVFSRYAGEGYFAGGMEWSAYFQDKTAEQCVDYAYSLGINFLHWVEVIGNYGQTFSTSDALSAVTAKAGKIASAMPSNLT